MQIYNTLTRKLEEFKPINPSNVTFYQCGPTVYSHQHIGNLFSAVKGDLIRRSLQFLGYDVKYTRNITDVGHLVSDGDEGEDKIAKGAKREGLSPKEITEKYTKIYHDDLTKLNVEKPTFETKATEYIDQMVELVQNLINKGFAYATDKAIYFEVDKFPKYNELNRQNLEKNIGGAGHGGEDDPGKKKPYDFAVWFFKTGSHANALQTWEKKFKGIDQPILAGFPGWHIECSAMAEDTLGQPIDIHMGGVEHIQVHHTNEIAQSECGYGKKFANYWLHHEMLLIDGGKMSKSLGNIYTLDQLIEKGYDPLDYRYFLLQAHYRSRQNFTWEALEGAKSARKKLVATLREMQKGGKILSEYKKKFDESLETDFNLPQALAVVWDILKSEEPDADKRATILEFDKVLGLKLTTNEVMPRVFTDDQYNQIEDLIEQRAIAKKSNDFETADKIRTLLKSKYNVLVQDKQDGESDWFEDL
ncbi:cysteine--tRNA ligase [Candidatus Dojkabacteria bacterium]|nr:cysteine--tRNA ligase [Candidatus Dojkabacteria bacterium]